MGVKRLGVQAAVRTELAGSDKQNTALGRTALALAARLDSGEDPGSAMAAMAKELRQILADLGVNAVTVKNPLDELKRRREVARPMRPPAKPDPGNAYGR